MTSILKLEQFSINFFVWIMLLYIVVSEICKCQIILII